MGYSNFMDQFRTAGGGFGMKAYNDARARGFSGRQIKTAIQQIGRNTTGRNTMGAAFKAQLAQHTGGQFHKPEVRNFSRFQGTGGQMGIKSYMDAKNEGFTPDQIKSGLQGTGMFMPWRASRQYEMDKENERQRDAQLDYIRSLEERSETTPTTIGRSASYAVGKGGNTQLKIKEEPKKGKRGSGFFNRKSWGVKPMNPLNSGGFGAAKAAWGAQSAAQAGAAFGVN